jgi:hypothetical protein
LALLTAQVTPLPPPLELLELLEELELLLEELELDELELDDDELLDDELLELPPDTVTEKFCVLCAPQLLVKAAVAVHEPGGVTVCSRDEPDVPQPFQFQEPPEVGWGPN